MTKISALVGTQEGLSNMNNLYTTEDRPALQETNHCLADIIVTGDGEIPPVSPYPQADNLGGNGAGQVGDTAANPNCDVPLVAQSQAAGSVPVKQAGQEQVAVCHTGEKDSVVSLSQASDNVDASKAPEKRGEPIKCAPRRAAKEPMMKRLRRGKTVLVIRSYAELNRVAKAFGDRHYKLIILIGNPGLGKTRLFKVGLIPWDEYVSRL